VDAVALASVISSATVGLAVAFYSAHRTAKTAWEGRVEQRSADGLWVPETVHRACDLLLHVRQEPGMIHRWRFG
jgi:hypothetical protein